jgi:acyl-CoA synthetase (AMP-forming)/AMP-acid ligase II/thioesterase domain-containing protein/acyl carrier protein
MDYGAVAPLSPTLNVQELATQIEARRIDGLVVEAALETDARDAATQCGIPVYEVPSGASEVGFTAGASSALGKVRDGRSTETSVDPELILMTSGTTSAGKVVPFSRARMLIWASGRTDIPTIGPADRCLVLRPLYYAAGIHDVMATIYSGGSAAVVDRYDVANFFHYFDTFEPTWFGGSPTLHERIYAAAKARSSDVIGSNLRFVRVSSGLLEASVANDLEEIFAAPLLESYGATEAGSIASNPGSLTARKRGTVGVAVGCSIKVVDDTGRAVATGERGEIIVKGPQVFDGYENNDEANAEAFIDGWFRTGDRGFFDADGFLTLTGRIKEMINRGGEKISPAEVDAALMAHPQVREAATFPIPHPTLGEEVAAAVVRKPGTSISDKDLTRFLITKLVGFKVPRRFVFVDEIPKTELGKVQRYKLNETLGIAGDGDAVERRIPNRDPTPFEYRIMSIWQEVLNLQDFGLDDNFFLLGGDSLLAVELFLQIELELGQRLPLAVLFEAGTVAEMAKLIEEGKPQGAIVAIQPEGTRPPFFCVHGATGQVVGFYNIAQHLGPDQPLYGIQSIGWDATTPPFTKTADMAAHYVAGIREVQPHGPYYLGGYSFGGRIAVYMANLLKEAGEEVALLAIMDTSSSIARIHVSYGQWLERIQAPPGPARIMMALRYGWFRIRKAYDLLYARGRRAVIFPIREYYRATGKSVPLSMRRPDRLNILIRIEHRKMPSYDGNAVYFKTALRPSSMSHTDIKESWNQIIKGRLDVVPVPGRHSEIIREPHVGVLAAELAKALKRAGSGNTG